MLQMSISSLQGLRPVHRASCPSTARPVIRSVPSTMAAHRHKPARHCRQFRVCAFDDDEEEDAATRHMYPNPDFVKETLEAFPEQGVANVEEARDVRPKLDWEDIGHVKGAVNIPLKHSKRVYNSEKKMKLAQKTDNPDFIKTVEKKFPNKESKILIGCSDGRAYSMDALMQLDEAGYTNLAGVRGGFYAWFRVFDNKLARRMVGEYAEQYTHSADSTGIHASGAGFERSDFAGIWQPPEGY